MESDASRSTLSEEKNAHTAPRIYVASLADYTVGELLGCWIDASQPIEDIRKIIARMLAQSTQPITEEWAIHDYENFGDLSLSEYEGLEHVADVALGIVEHGTVFGALVNHLGGASYVDDARRYMEAGYRGPFDSLADYAQDLVENCYADALKTLPDFIRYHIDFDGIGRDLELGGDVFTLSCDGLVHVFDGQI